MRYFMVFFLLINAAMASGQQTPNHILASVKTHYGTVQGSATVISKGSKYSLVLSSAHNFRDIKDSTFWIYYPDGTYTIATLLAIDNERDLSLARVESNAVLGTSYLTEIIEKGPIFGVGYINGEGPNSSELTYTGASYSEEVKYKWSIDATNRPKLDSGSGIFINESFVALIYQKENKATQMEACSHNEIIEFLNENKQGEECGDFKVIPKKQISPPIWKPNPNIPIFTNNLKIIELQNEITELKVQLSNQATQLSNQTMQLSNQVMQSDLKVIELQTELKSLKEQLSNKAVPSKIEDVVPDGLKLPSDVVPDCLKLPSDVEE